MHAFPTDSGVGSELGELDALDMLRAKSADEYGRVTTFDDSDAANDRAAAARREVDASKSAAVLGGAGFTLQQQLYTLEKARRPEQTVEIPTLAERYLKRAIEVDPKNGRWKSGLSTLYRAAIATDPKLKIQWMEKSAAVADDVSRGTALQSLAEAYVGAGDFAKAAETARDLLASAAKYPDNWAYGNAIHHGNIVLGRVAV
jgi:hypothetical protein